MAQENNGNLAGAVVSVKDLSYVTEPGSREKKELRPGDALYAHDVIDTSPRGAVKILLNDESVVDLGPSTRFQIDRYLQNHGSDRQVALTVVSGTMRSAITRKITGNGRFHVRTSAATMGVRGTEFVIQAGGSGPSAGATQVTVIQGEVAVAKTEGALDSGAGRATIGGKVVTLSAGQQISATPKAPLPSSATNLDAASLARVASSSKVVDNTFSKAVTIAVSSSSSGSAPSAGPAGSASQGRAPASSGTQASSQASGDTPTAEAPSGGATLAEIGSAAAGAAAAPPPLNIAQVGIAGTFSPTTTAAPVTTNNNISKVTIIVTHH